MQWHVEVSSLETRLFEGTRVGNSSPVNRLKTGENFSPFHWWNTCSNLLIKLVKKLVNHRWNTGKTVSPVTGSPLVRWIPSIPHTRRNHGKSSPNYCNQCCHLKLFSSPTKSLAHGWRTAAIIIRWIGSKAKQAEGAQSNIHQGKTMRRGGCH